MIRNSIDAFLRKDADLARKVLTSDDAVDNLRDEMYRNSRYGGGFKQNPSRH